MIIGSIPLTVGSIQHGLYQTGIGYIDQPFKVLREATKEEFINYNKAEGTWTAIDSDRLSRFSEHIKFYEISVD